jgi:flagellin-like protein
VRKIGSRKAVSPVISTVILVAVAITVAVAVAYWMGGIAGQYTKFEKVEIQSAWSEKVEASQLWMITVELKNTGSAASTLIRCFINDVPLNDTGYDTGHYPTPAIAGDTRVCTNFNATGLTLKSGDSAKIYVWISYAQATKWAAVTSGTTINIKLHSAGGMDYIKLVELV